PGRGQPPAQGEAYPGQKPPAERGRGCTGGRSAIPPDHDLPPPWLTAAPPLTSAEWQHYQAPVRLALALGLFVGPERERRGKEAGVRTFPLHRVRRRAAAFHPRPGFRAPRHAPFLR